MIENIFVKGEIKERKSDVYISNDFGQSWIFNNKFVNTSQLGQFGTPTSSLPSLLFELGIAQMNDQDSS